MKNRVVLTKGKYRAAFGFDPPLQYLFCDVEDVEATQAARALNKGCEPVWAFEEFTAWAQGEGTMFRRDLPELLEILGRFGFTEKEVLAKLL